METVTIGTCTADKQETLDKLLHLGITASITAETDKILPEDITPSSDPLASEIEMDRSVLDIPESTSHLALHQHLHPDSQPLKLSLQGLNYQ